MKLKIQTSREEKMALDFWDEFYLSLQTAGINHPNETEEEKTARIKDLEANPLKWMQYYFEKHCAYEFTPFHKRFIKRAIENPEIYLVNAWARSLAKTGVTFLVMMYLHCTGKKKFTLMISATKDSAIRLLRPYKLAFEKNINLINDYGEQVNQGQWAEDEFCTRSGSMFIAVGKGQAPRGARNEEKRPDSLIFDDFDTDEDCRNPDMIDKYWDWAEQAALGTRDSTPTLVIHNGNIIAEYCSIKKSIAVCDYYEIVNIRDKNGKSTWADKNSEEVIDRIISKMSAASAQKEYFNNPIVMGKIFPKLNYGKIQPLKKYKYLVAYTDPSYKKNGDFKATALVGKYKDEYHIIDMFCQKTSTANMLEFLYSTLKKTANVGVSVYFYIEYPWIDDALKREIKEANARHNLTLPLKADERKKPDKFFRIESNLEPLNRNGKLIFNEELKGNPNMKETEFQFLALSPKSRAHDDAPDSVEGAVWVINHKALAGNATPKSYPMSNNKKRY